MNLTLFFGYFITIFSIYYVLHFIIWLDTLIKNTNTIHIYWWQGWPYVDGWEGWRGSSFSGYNW
jgi:hypothetical protein